MRTLKATVVAAALAMFAAPGIAVNMSFLDDAPVTRLNAAELEKFRAFIITNLDQAADGTVVEWRSGAAEFRSKVTMQKSATDGAYRCRQARIESHASDRQASGNYWFCKTDGGSWAYRIPSKNAKPAAR